MTATLTRRVKRLTPAIGSLTFAYMKDAVLTIRLPSQLRRRIERLALAEGRSLSQQAERLMIQGMERMDETPPLARDRPSTDSLAGTLGIGRVPELADFRFTRSALSASLLGGPTGRRRR